jgi:hypothetical protein
MRKELVAFGCSVTKGSELKSNIKDAYCQHLGRMLNVDKIYNHGISADNNQSIIIRTIGFIEQWIRDPENQKTMLYVTVMFTEPQRRLIFNANFNKKKINWRPSNPWHFI